jgi:predicted site-specific integrase-resolvase
MITEITLPDAASRLHLPWHAANKLAMKGDLGAVRQVAGRWLVSEEGVLAYLERQRVETERVASVSPVALGTP